MSNYTQALAVGFGTGTTFAAILGTLVMCLACACASARTRAKLRRY
jgi:hypothetical protein